MDNKRLVSRKLRRAIRESKRIANGIHRDAHASMLRSCAELAAEEEEKPECWRYKIDAMDMPFPCRRKPTDLFQHCVSDDTDEENDGHRPKPAFGGMPMPLFDP